MLRRAFVDKAVEEVFNAQPPKIRSKLLALRQLIFDVASGIEGVGSLEEALRWGQASYLTRETGSGSTIRIDGVRNVPGKIAMYLHCQSGLVDEIKNHYKNQLTFEGKRAIILDVAEELPVPELRHCISLALTHHLRKNTSRRRAEK